VDDLLQTDAYSLPSCRVGTVGMVTCAWVRRPVASIRTI
jgi:hypothetical protein